MERTERNGSPIQPELDLHTLEVREDSSERQLMLPISFKLKPGQEISLSVDEYGVATIDVLRDKGKEKEFPIFEHLGTGVKIDTEIGRVDLPDGSFDDLTRYETKLTALFFSKPNRVISKEEYLATIHPDMHPDEMTESHFRDSMKVHVRRIRKKIETDPEKPIIRNVRGFGYFASGEFVRHSK